MTNPSVGPQIESTVHHDGAHGLPLFRTLVNLTNDALFVIDPATSRFLDVNLRACTSLGFPREELLRMGVVDVDVTLPDEASWEEHVDKVRRQGNLLREGLHRRRGGETFPVEVNVAHVTVDNQDYMVAVARDITERKQAETALRLSEERFRTFVEQATDAFFLHAEGGIIIDVNSRACESLGYTRDELIGKSLFDIDPIVTEELLQACRERLERGETISLETVHRRKDGTTFPVEIRTRPFVVDDRLFAVALAQDISARRRADEMLRTHSQVLHSMSEGVSFMDEAGVIVYANPALEAMFGYAPGELIGRHVTTFNDATPAENVQIVRDVHASLEREGLWKGEFRNRRKDGTVFYTQAQISRLERPGQVYWVSVQQDVTERKHAEQQLAKLRDELEQQARLGAIGELTAGIAHELSQPLAAIANFAFAIRTTLERISAGQGPTDVSSCLTMAQNLEEQALRCGDIIRRLRGLIRRQALVRTPVDMHEIVAEVATLLAGELQQAGIALELDVPPSLPQVAVDPLQIQQVLFNLCRNAIEAMRFQATERRLRISASLADSSSLVVRVRDWGPGIPDAIKNDIFTPFATTKGDGMGFGLPICRRIIESHLGRLWRSPDVTPGAELCFSLPVGGRGRPDRV